MSPADLKNPVLKVHATTLPHLDFIEKIIFDELIRQNRAVLIDEQEAACPRS